MLNKSLLVATILFVIAGPALAQQAPMPAPQTQRPSPFERLDRNDDGDITREEVAAARNATFMAMDLNRDGFLTNEEMARRQTVRRGPNGETRQRGGAYDGGRIDLKRADANQDTNVTRAEFDAAFQESSRHTADFRAQLRNNMFARFDANRDGTISAAEMILPPRGPLPVTISAPSLADGPPPPTGQGGRPNARRPNPDTNNDQKISLAEWLARPDPLFERGDTNNDGRITREEAAAFMRQGRGEGGRSRRPW